MTILNVVDVVFDAKEEAERIHSIVNLIEGTGVYIIEGHGEYSYSRDNNPVVDGNDSQGYRIKFKGLKQWDDCNRSEQENIASIFMYTRDDTNPEHSHGVALLQEMGLSSEEAVIVLSSFGVDINGYSGFMNMCVNGSVDEIDRAIELGVDVNRFTTAPFYRDGIPNSLCYIPKPGGYAKRLVDGRMAYFSRTNPMIISVREGRADVLDLMLSKGGGDMLLTDDFGDNAFDWALKMSKPDDFITDDPEKKARCLPVFFKHMTIDEYKELSEKHQNIHHLAAQHASLEDLKRFQEAGVFDINSRDQDGNTPLHMAAKAGAENNVRWLVENGANVNAKNHNYEGPLYFAKGNAGCYDYLKSKGGREVPDAVSSLHQHATTVTEPLASVRIYNSTNVQGG